MNKCNVCTTIFALKMNYRKRNGYGHKQTFCESSSTTEISELSDL